MRGAGSGWKRARDRRRVGVGCSREREIGERASQRSRGKIGVWRCGQANHSQPNSQRLLLVVVMRGYHRWQPIHTTTLICLQTESNIISGLPFYMAVTVQCLKKFVRAIFKTFSFSIMYVLISYLQSLLLIKTNSSPSTSDFKISVSARWWLLPK